MGTALKINSSLTELDIGGNRFGNFIREKVSHFSVGNGGARAIAEGIADNKFLTKLNFRSNQISDEGAIAFASTLKKNNYLKELFLGGNKIQSNGLVALSEALRLNRGLAKFDVQVYLDCRFSRLL